MRRFWKGLLWGGIIGTVLAAVIAPMAKPQKKPFMARSTDVIRTKTEQLLKEARKTRKRLMKKI